MYIELLKEIIVMRQGNYVTHYRGLILFKHDFSKTHYSFYPNSNCNDLEYMGIINKDILLNCHYREIGKRLTDLIL